MRRKFIYIFLLGTNFAFAQDSLLKLEDALAITLQNNYAIQIVRNDEQISKNNNTLGNAGFLPRVDLNASGNVANNATRQNFSNGLVVDQHGVKSSNITSGVYLNWVLFDGLKMFATQDRLGELQQMGMLSAKVLIENTVADVINAYFEVVRQKQLLKGIEENIAISDERLKIAEKRLSIGAGSKVDVLQAKVDMNAQRTARLRQQNILEESKVDLNQLMARPVETAFNVSDSIPITFVDNTYEEYKNTVLKQNTSLLFAQSNMKVSEFGLKELRSQRYPRLALTTHYLFSRSENQAGFSLLNQNLGINHGFTATWNLSNGGIVNTQVKNARLEILNASAEFNNTRLLIESALMKTFRRFYSDQEILKIEEENIVLAKENLSIALERFKLGLSNSLEVKQAQGSYEDAITRTVSARYTAKLSETELMKLRGMLLK